MSFIRTVHPSAAPSFDAMYTQPFSLPPALTPFHPQQFHQLPSLLIDSQKPVHKQTR